ncbi:MAG: transketolase [Clostridiales bacterium]
MDKIKKLEEIAFQLRKDVITTIYKCGDGHPGPSLSSTDIIVALYFEIMNVKPENHQWENRDRFIISKGHACPTVYAALAEKGYFSKEILPTLRKINSILQGHPDMLKTPGIDAPAGTLGNGISIGAGMALAARIKKKDYYTYVITGDGELNEGVIWEGIMGAAHYKLDNLIVFVDNNGYQSGGKVDKISGILPLDAKWISFGWHVQEINGHNIKEILEAVDIAKKTRGIPSVIIAHTIKGKGIPLMENDNVWHKGAPSKEQYEEIMTSLGGE